jgi:hypothetical protein
MLLPLVAVMALGGCVTLTGARHVPSPFDQVGTPVTPVAATFPDPMTASTPPYAGSPPPAPAPTGRPTSTRTTARTPRPTAAETPLATIGPAPTPRATPRLHPKPRAGALRIDLYRRGDFVSELEAWYCMPAAMQTMLNIMDTDRPDRTRRTQDRLYRLARRYSSDRLDGKGAEPIGWARTLEHLGYGQWEVKAFRTRGQAVKAAVKALRLTGKPVGMLTWHGAHSWVMSGFRASADPALTDDYRVVSIAIEDVWYPRVSSIWGPSDPPDTWMRVEDLGRDYLRYHRWTVRYPGLDGRYVMVLPVPEGPAG